MSNQLTDVEAQLLLDQSNRRAKLLKTVQGSFLGYLSSYVILGSLGLLGGEIVLILLLGLTIGRVEDLISAIVLVVLISTVLVPIYVVNKRMDALVALLREDGILRDMLPGAKHSEKA